MDLLKNCYFIMKIKLKRSKKTGIFLSNLRFTHLDIYYYKINFSFNVKNV